MAGDEARAVGERFLAELQRAAWQANPPPPDSTLAQSVETRRLLRQRIAADPSFAEEFRARFRDRGEAEQAQAEAFLKAGEYEDPWAYRVVRGAATDVERALSELGRRVPTAVIVGTARTRLVNAVAYAPDPSTGGAYVVVIDGGMLPFLADLALLLARLLPAGREGETTRLSMRPEAVRAHLDANDELVERTADDAARFVAGEYPLEQLLGNDGPTGDVRRFANMLYHLMTVFVVGHEYAHVHMGHLAGDPGGARPAAEAERWPNAITYDWFLEAEADGGGVEVALHTTRRYAIHPSIGFLACQLYFAGVQILGLGEAIARTGSVDRAADEVSRLEEAALERPNEVAPYVSHPPPLLRRRAIRTMLRASTSPETFETLVSGSREFDGAFAEILGRLAPALERRLVNSTT